MLYKNLKMCYSVVINILNIQGHKGQNYKPMHGGFMSKRFCICFGQDDNRGKKFFLGIFDQEEKVFSPELYLGETAYRAIELSDEFGQNDFTVDLSAVSEEDIRNFKLDSLENDPCFLIFEEQLIDARERRQISAGIIGY